MSLYQLNQSRLGTNLSLPGAEVMMLQNHSPQQSLLSIANVACNDPKRMCPRTTQSPECSNGKWVCPTQQNLSLSLESVDPLHSKKFTPEYAYNSLSS